MTARHGRDHLNVSEWLAGYDKSKITIGVVASHSSLQILHGARQEGFQTLGIVVGEERKRYYAAFPGADPDEWLVLDNYAQLFRESRLDEKKERHRDSTRFAC